MPCYTSVSFLIPILEYFWLGSLDLDLIAVKEIHSGRLLIQSGLILSLSFHYPLETAPGAPRLVCSVGRYTSGPWETLFLDLGFLPTLIECVTPDISPSFLTCSRRSPQSRAMPMPNASSHDLIALQRLVHGSISSSGW